MDPDRLKGLLEQLAAGSVDVAAAMKRLRTLPFENLEFARIDHHRALRCGFPEVIFGQGKTPEQVAEIFARLAEAGHDVLATRVEPAAAARVLERFPNATHHELPRLVTLR
ncbi:MAG: 1-(5-phosphoribosyl)-5-amino-4-imidazole-carboxylate carboxylase, partial [Proteobacteria bacterium]|nr:1-(5-phosphoribosyl)-5-amino-4-imidazole-carboxylate carboxylase [Pseudomonadota bacterium]